MVAKVAIDDVCLGQLYDYEIPQALISNCAIGAKVNVRFRNRITTAYIIELAQKSDFQPTPQIQAEFNFGLETTTPGLSPILSVEEGLPPLLPPLITLAKWMSDYYLSTLEKCLQTLLPSPVRTGKQHEKTQYYVEATENTPQELTPRQKELVDNIKRVEGGWLNQILAEFKTNRSILKKLQELNAITIEERAIRRDPLANRRILPSKPLPLNDEQAYALSQIQNSINSPTPKPQLIFGVTGSGKTEVYLQAIAYALSQNKGAIVLVPEISLTPQTVQRFASRFGTQIAVLHSALSDGERYDEWQRIRQGKALVVIGPRSAVFAPIANLGLIIVDEEHEPSYKQDEIPHYNARDVAVMRAHIEHASCLLGSATPSFESWNNAQIGKYNLLRLSKRASKDAKMPLVHIIDMRQEHDIAGRAQFFSHELLQGIQDRLESGEQTILFLNRRGFATQQICPNCGYIATCDNCDIPYTYHRNGDVLRCHICNKWERPQEKCPACGDPTFKYTGAGTERIEYIISRCFPKAKIGRMDQDSTSRKRSHEDILNDFRIGKTQILIGTQMIAKGLHFPKVTLVGIIMADSSLNKSDFRASERTFQLLAQVSGRTGRGELTGEVFIQTYTPEHIAIRMAQTENFEGFAKTELPIRQKSFYPPFSHIICLTLSGTNEQTVSILLETIASHLHSTSTPKHLLISEVAPATLYKANNHYRYTLLLRSTSIPLILHYLRPTLSLFPIPPPLHLKVDIDALNI